MVGDVLYRYYAPSGAVDWIANAPGIVDFEPLSNVEVAWWAEELSAGEPIQSIHAHGPQANQPEPAVMPRYYITSTLAGETEELGVEEWLDRRTTENTGDIMQSAAPQAAAANLSFNIRNVILPKPGYEHGTSYTYNGSPCNPAHPNTVTSNCRRYNNSAQCAAFGWEIIDYLFSTRPNPVTYPTTKPYLFTDLATVRIFLDYTCAGASARVRYYKDNYGEHGHTIILANIDSNNYRVVVYDANWDNRCGIRLLELTYQEFANQMKNAINYRTLPHSYSSYTATANLHYKACIHCHSAHINTNSHTYVGGRCSVCGYLYRG